MERKGLETIGVVAGILTTLIVVYYASGTYLNFLQIHDIKEKKENAKNGVNVKSNNV
jgi:hypothetical protein